MARIELGSSGLRSLRSNDSLCPGFIATLMLLTLSQLIEHRKCARAKASISQDLPLLPRYLL